MLKISRALVSVSDKSGILEFVKGLLEFGVEIISTGGTANLLRNAGIPVKEVSEITGFQEMLDGRVKTLHPAIFGAVLAQEKHLNELAQKGIKRIELVCVNLYPFQDTIAREHTLEEAIESIDIGGPSLIRAAAKNYCYTAVVTKKEQYPIVLEEMRKTGGGLSKETLQRLAVEAFKTTAIYDAAVYSYFQKKFIGEEFPDTFIAVFEKKHNLRYGENPHQKAAFYAEHHVDFPCITNAEKIQGKELSYNNILDLDAAWNIVTEFTEPTCAIVKHINPSSVAKGENVTVAFERCIGSDPLSAYGGIVAFNATVTEDCALKMKKYFLDAIIAPDYEEGALKILAKKKSIVLRTGRLGSCRDYEMKKVCGGLLIQERDTRNIVEEELRCASKRLPTNEEIAAMLFGWKVVRHVTSNAIVFAKENETVGIGSGQTSRVMAVKIAAEKAGERAKGAVMASDGFFPFRDGIDVAAKAGITAVIQPGGSIRDGEVIDAVNEYGMAMVFTGWRVFRH